MTTRDGKALANYIRCCADVMELRDWQVELMPDPADADNNASVRIVYGRKLAQIYVNADFRTYTPERQRHTIAHELVHCHLESSTNMVRNDLEEHLGKHADKLFWTAYQRQMEYGVDALASALAKHLPLIRWPGERAHA